MPSGNMSDFLLTTLEIMAAAFIFVVGLIALITVALFVVDVSQTRHAIRRNYPVIGRFRYLFEKLGKFFRQYFFAMDREELPFNRAERSWVYQTAKNMDSTRAFGSTKDLRPTGAVFFVNTPFPTLYEDVADPAPITIGPQTDYPYTPETFFHISGMSYGALSTPAVRALSRGARMAGCWLNTGEGGLSPYHLEGGCDVVFQFGTAKYGVRDEHGRLDDDRLREIARRDAVRMFEIKLSQGAKPGKGGILPGRKVTPEIASIRGIPAYEDSISPNRHAEIRNAGDLLDMVARVRDVTGRPTGFKAVMGSADWLRSLLDEVARRGPGSAPDFITVDGAEGGSGAAPMSLMDNMGLPLREGLPLVVDHLDAYGLRGRVRVIASGKLITPAEVAWALCMGADFVVSARGFMFALGCIQAMQCNRDTCPTGVTTHDPRLQRGLVAEDKAVRVMHYAKNMVREVGVIAHACGVRSPQELTRHNARVMTDRGVSAGMDELFPYVGTVHVRPHPHPSIGGSDSRQDINAEHAESQRTRR